MKKTGLLTLLLLASCNTTPERALNEPLPGQVSAPASASASATPSASPSIMPDTPLPSASPTPAGLTTLKQGRFRDAVHKVSGEALLLEQDGARFLRLASLMSENGPDLYVYLVRRADGTPQGPADFVSLGRLRSTQGNQNYPLPAELELADIQAVTIWCQAFSVNFGYAPL